MNNKWYKDLTSRFHCTTLGSEIKGISQTMGEIMVDFEHYRTIGMSDIVRTGGGAAGGITVRDYFAAEAMAALIASHGRCCVNEEDGLAGTDEDDWPVGEVRNEYWCSHWCARDAYTIADNMMKERNKRPEESAPTVEEAFGL
jgi:hypothetical protein